MAERIYLPRALDANADVVEDAVATFFDAGTTTPRIVFDAADLATPLGTSLNADAEGVFPAAWVDDGVRVKVNIENIDGIALPGWDNQDDVGRFLEGGADLDNSIFDPIPGNAATNGQAAIANNTTSITDLQELGNLQTATGSGGAYAINAAVTITSYKVRQRFVFVANHPAAATNTLNVDGLGAIPIRWYKGGIGLIDVSLNSFGANDVVEVVYDGTQFIAISLVDIANPGRLGTVLRATEDQTRNGVDFVWPAAPEIKKVWGWTDSVTGDLTNGGANDLAEYDFLGLPTNLSEIQVLVNQASLSGTGSLLVQFFVAGLVVTTGYTSSSRFITTNENSTAGHVVQYSSASIIRGGILRLSKLPGVDYWVSEHAFSIALGGGSVDLSGPPDGIRITTTNGNTFDAGSVVLRYR